MAKKPKKLGKDKTVAEWLLPKLRDLSRQWPRKGVAQAKARVKVESGEFYKNGNPIILTKYKCAICGGLFDKEEVDVDHIQAVVGLDGFTNWDDYINNLFCDSDNLQILCKADHYLKSQAENAERRERKKLAKNIKKDDNLY